MRGRRPVVTGPGEARAVRRHRVVPLRGEAPCAQSTPARAPAALPCRLVDPAVFVCSYPVADRAELTVVVAGGASAGYGVSGIEFGD